MIKFIQKSYTELPDYMITKYTCEGKYLMGDVVIFTVKTTSEISADECINKCKQKLKDMAIEIIQGLV